MDNSNDILKKVRHNDGIIIPEGFLDKFAADMMASLPETGSHATVAPTLWLRLKPYVYMAAMFAGIFCMMKMFSMMRNPSADLNIDNYPVLTATLENTDTPVEVVDDINQFEILDDMYNDGFSASDIFSDEDSVAMESEEANFNLPH